MFLGYHSTHEGSSGVDERCVEHSDRLCFEEVYVASGLGCASTLSTAGKRATQGIACS